MGYGYDSIEATARRRRHVNAAAPDWRTPKRWHAGEKVLDEIDRRGIIATPANSYINELVMEAARQSITENGQTVTIDYTRVERATPPGPGQC